MDLDDIDTIGVVGAGTMGSGIAQVSALAGYDVVMRDIEPELVEDGFDAIEDRQKQQQHLHNLQIL